MTSGSNQLKQLSEPSRKKTSAANPSVRMGLQPVRWFHHPWQEVFTYLAPISLSVAPDSDVGSH